VKDLAVLPYSSGTTGLRRGMLTHQNLTANIRQTLALNMTTESGVVLDFLPFFHIYGMMVLLNCGLAIGATQIILPRFEPEAGSSCCSATRSPTHCESPSCLLANQPRLGSSTCRSALPHVRRAPLPAEVGRQAAGSLAAWSYGDTATVSDTR
jgi:acyl-CoA synthetase (AMP-forming)/AMP-acid ligase II